MKLSECEHTPHNWNLVYQCRGCGEIVPEEIAAKHESQLEADKERLLEQLVAGEELYISRGIELVQLEAENAALKRENEWMRREIERVGRALFTGTETGYVGTEEDLHAVGQFVEGVCEAVLELAQLEEENAELKRGDATFRGSGDNDIIQNDMRHLMNVLGISTHARPISPHEVFVSEIIPKVAALKRENEALKQELAEYKEGIEIEQGWKQEAYDRADTLFHENAALKRENERLLNKIMSALAALDEGEIVASKRLLTNALLESDDENTG